MKLDWRPVPETESARVRQFLSDIFQPSADALFLEAAQMHWKYWEPHPSWPGSRSYAYVDQAEQMIAHACAWPFALGTTEKTLAGAHPIDWAATKTVPGGGALLLRQMRALRDISCCIGGTDMAQKVIQQSGFKPVATMRYLARPLRPLHQALTHQRRDWKLPARVIRNTMWTLRAPNAPADWTADRIQPADLPGELLPAASQGQAVAQRSAELFAYMLKCPTVRFELWLVRQGREPRGYFLLSFASGQARIVDAWIASARGKSWQALYATAVNAALQDKSVGEITTCGTLDEALTGAAACGFRHYGELPVMLFDPKKQLAPINQFHLQMMDNDMSFLSQKNRTEYIT